MQYAINLFPEKEKDIFDKIMAFAFGYLRYILVITQFVVICVFFFRLSVDQQIVDLKEKLSQKEAILKSTKSLLDDVSDLESRTTLISGLLKKQSNFQSTINYFLDGLPSDFSLNTVQIDETGILINGFSTNPASIQEYQTRMETEGRFKSITLDNIQKTSSGFSFTFQLNDYSST